jgi:hypothetical protein
MTNFTTEEKQVLIDSISLYYDKISKTNAQIVRMNPQQRQEHKEKLAAITTTLQKLKSK